MTIASDPSKTLDFLVDRQDLRHTRFEEGPAADAIDLAPGQALLRVAKFAFTANNVTYGVVGETLSYWNFFPAPDGWGRIPVWGFGDVIRSRHEDVHAGERVFGYFPMSTHVVMQAEAVTGAGWLDASPHRAHMSALYNQYRRVKADPGYDSRYEDHQMLFWPLFMTGFVLDDSLAEKNFFGGRTVILSSASSKTAFGLAFLLSRRPEIEVVGLTAARNVPFVSGLGCYDRVLAYEAIGELPADVPSAFVDMAGDVEVVSAVHNRLRERLVYSGAVGVTHWERGGTGGDLPGAAPVFFFAPSEIERRIATWGLAGLQERFGTAWRAFLERAEGWIRVVPARGPEAVERVYRETLEGRARPEGGHVLAL